MRKVCLPNVVLDWRGQLRQIRFRFDPDKLVNALAFFSRAGVFGLDQMKIAKLVFLADREHLLRYGRTITGDQYVCMEHGPVPSKTRDLVNARLADDQDAESMREFFDVGRSRTYPELIAKREANLEVFSDTDIEVLTEVARKYGPRTAWQLRDLAHDFPEIKAALAARLAAEKKVVPVPFESFFTANSGSLVDLVKQDQDDRDFAESLNW
ncbi:MAG: Panacea domain-containing protein [Acidobacteriota bacterium]|nr:Panacea domain-containing protein [Acidobacteriota bacterium]